MIRIAEAVRTFWPHIVTVVIFAAMIWIIYLFYYNSRVVGLFLTLIINRFVKYGHIKIGMCDATDVQCFNFTLVGY